MSFTIEFDDQNLTERIRDPYKGIDETRPLGLSFMDFLSLGEELQRADHLYFKLDDDSDSKTNMESFYYVRLREYVDLCIKDLSLYSIETFMFLLHLLGLGVPEHYQQFYLDGNSDLKDLVKRKQGMSNFEIALRGFAKYPKTGSSITSVYTCESLEDVCTATLYHLAQLGLTIKKCSNCGKYFVPLRRSDAIYCDRISPFHKHKTCKEDGSQRTYEEKLKLDEAEKLKRQIYQSKQMRIRRNPDIPGYMENFEKWKTETKKWKKEILKGQKTTDEFIEWLHKSRKKY